MRCMVHLSRLTRFERCRMSMVMVCITVRQRHVSGRYIKS